MLLEMAPTMPRDDADRLPDETRFYGVLGRLARDEDEDLVQAVSPEDGSVRGCPASGAAPGVRKTRSAPRYFFLRKYLALGSRALVVGKCVGDGDGVLPHELRHGALDQSGWELPGSSELDTLTSWLGAYLVRNTIRRRSLSEGRKHVRRPLRSRRGRVERAVGRDRPQVCFRAVAMILAKTTVGRLSHCIRSSRRRAVVARERLAAFTLPTCVCWSPTSD
jgi:hypothetical protein